MAARTSTASLLATALVVLLCLWPATLPAATPDYITSGNPIPDSLPDVQTPMTDSFAKPEAQARKLGVGSRLKKQPSFIRDSKINLRIRTSYSNRDTENAAQKLAWAGGGWLEYTSGWLEGRLQTGGTLYTSQPLYAPKENSGTLLLAPGGEGITVLGQAYVKLRLVEGTNLELYRQSLELPFINRRDSRMIPNTFEAYTLSSETWQKCKFILGQVTAIKNRNSNRFVSMARAAGADGDGDGLSLAGVLFSPNDNLDIGFIEEYSWQMMSTFYAEANATFKLSQKFSLRLSAQFADQASVGQEWLGSFRTNFWGLQLGAGYGGAIFSLAYNTVDSGGRILHPYGGYPGYSSLIVQDFARAGESAWVLGLTYDFAGIGLPGLGMTINYATGDTPDNGNNASPDMQELDLNLDYRPKGGYFEGVWLRLRTALVDQQGRGAADTAEFQCTLNYDISLL